MISFLPLCALTFSYNMMTVNLLTDFIFRLELVLDHGNKIIYLELVSNRIWPSGTDFKPGMADWNWSQTRDGRLELVSNQG